MLRTTSNGKKSTFEAKVKTIEDPGLPAWQRETGMTDVK